MQTNTNTGLGMLLLVSALLLLPACHATTGGGRAPAAAHVGGPCFGAAPCCDTRGVLVDHLGRRIPGQRR